MGEVKVNIDFVQFKKWFVEPYKPLTLGNPHYYERKRNLINNPSLEANIKERLENSSHTESVKLGMYRYMPNNSEYTSRYEVDESTLLLTDNVHQEELAFAMTYHHETKVDSKKYGVVYSLVDRLLDIMGFLVGVNLSQTVKDEAQNILSDSPIGRLGLFSQSWLSPSLYSIWGNSDNEASLLCLSEHEVLGDVLSEIVSAISKLTICHGCSMDYIASLTPVRRLDAKLRTIFMNFATYCLEELFKTLNGNSVKITSLSHSKLIGLISNPEDAPRIIFTCQGSQFVLDPLVVNVNDNNEIINNIIKGGLC